MKTIAIIGCGFSGSMAALHLLSQNEINCRVLIFDPASQPARGVAYAVESLAFLLNVPAETMGAFPDKPGDFVEWLNKKNLPYSGDDFVPRKIYGDYLQEMLEVFIVEKGNLELKRSLVQQVDLIADKWRLLSSDGSSCEVDAIILATGYPRQKFSFLNPHLEQSYQGFENCSKIAIVGSGLTAVDVFELCRMLGYQGEFVVISRSGKFPYVNKKMLTGACEFQFLNEISNSRIPLARLLICLRKDIVNFGVDRVLHELRPYLVSLWQNLSFSEKQQFYRHLESRWNRVRHRMPESSAKTISELIAAGRLKIIRGSFKKCEERAESNYRISYQSQASLQQIDVNKVFDCRGPDISPRSNELVKNLLEQNIIEITELKRGIITSSQGRASSLEKPALYIIGPLRREELLETTAVRELREQVREVSMSLVRELVKKE